VRAPAGPVSPPWGCQSVVQETSDIGEAHEECRYVYDNWRGDVTNSWFFLTSFEKIGAIFVSQVDAT